VAAARLQLVFIAIFIVGVIDVLLIILHSVIDIISQLAFESENFIPPRVEVFPLDVGRQRVLLVGQQRDLDVRVGGPAKVLGSQSLGLDDLHRQRLLVEVVRDAELDASELLGAQRRVVRLLDGGGGGSSGSGGGSSRLLAAACSVGVRCSADLQQSLMKRRPLVGRRHRRRVPVALRTLQTHMSVHKSVLHVQSDMNAIPLDNFQCKA